MWCNFPSSSKVHLNFLLMLFKHLLITRILLISLISNLTLFKTTGILICRQNMTIFHLQFLPLAGNGGKSISNHFTLSQYNYCHWKQKIDSHGVFNQTLFLASLNDTFSAPNNSSNATRTPVAITILFSNSSFNKRHMRHTIE